MNQVLHGGLAHTSAMDHQSSIRSTRAIVFLYILLLFTEGALRKWGIPSLSNVLLLIRDPVAILLLFKYMFARRSFVNNYTLAMTVIGVISFATTMIFGHGNVIVGAYGLRTILLHFCVVFVIGDLLDKDDVIWIGRKLLVVSVPVTVLVAAQFLSPQSALVNRAVGGGLEGSGFGGALGYFRPSGLFSFTNGNVLFYSLLVAYVFYFWLNTQQCSKLWLIAATACAIVALPINISRQYFLQVAISLLLFVGLSFTSSKNVWRLLGFVAVSPLLLALLVRFEFMQTGIEVMTARFTQASNSEGQITDSIGNRIFGNMLKALFGRTGHDVSFWGAGIGLSSNLSSYLIAGKRTFLLSEDEWSRIVEEMGPMLGIGVLILRVSLAAQLSIAAIKHAFAGQPLAVMLLSTSFFQIVLGNWNQPTSLGFFAVTTGLTIAALSSPDQPAAGN